MSENIAFGQFAYDKYEETELSVTLKNSGGNYGWGGSEVIIVCINPTSELSVAPITKESVTNG